MHGGYLTLQYSKDKVNPHQFENLVWEIFHLKLCHIHVAEPVQMDEATISKRW